MKTDISINKVDRSVVTIKKAGEPDNNFVDAPPEVLLGFMWELTKEMYSLSGNFDVEQPLQRHVTKLIKL